MTVNKSKDLPNPPPEKFLEAFITGGGSICECACGRTHYNVNNLSEREVEQCRAANSKRPDEYVEHEDAWPETVGIDGNVFVADCPCNGLSRYADFIWNNRRRIAEFLVEEVKHRLELAKLDHALVGEPLTNIKVF